MMGFLKKYKASRWIVLFCAAFCLYLIISFLFVVGDFFGMTLSSGNEVMVHIPEGSTVRDISAKLKEEGIIKYPFFFRVYEKLDKNDIFQQGTHILETGQSYGEIIKKLNSSPEISEDKVVKVLIPEGYEARQIAKKLAEMGLVDEKKFMDILENADFDFDFVKKLPKRENRLEGYLFPATYELFANESEYDIIKRMLKTFEEKILPIYSAADTNYTLDEVVTFASMVEREAANDTERPIIASVFYNRMSKDMTLSSCATVQYIIKERKKILSNSDIKINSPYNTYINKGLPPGPIASPGESSVKAVLYPEKTDYYYFAARLDGTENVFSKTGEEHLNTVRRLQGGN